MEGKRKPISTTMTALLIVVVVLASSTLYLAFLAYQPKSAGTTANGGPQNSQLSSFDVANAASPSNTDTPSANSITVSGTGQVSYAPNEALIQVSVQTNNGTAVAATVSNAKGMTNVIKALNGMGISNGSIETQGFSLSANYANCYSSCVPQIIGYSVTNSLVVNITSSDPTGLGLKAGKVIDTSVNAGANGISLSFGASNAMLGQLTNEALQNAVASADGQAKAIASSLGVSISGVISAGETSYSYYPYNYGTFAAAAPAATISVPTPIMVGTQTISAAVQVVYSIS